MTSLPRVVQQCLETSLGFTTEKWVVTASSEGCLVSPMHRRDPTPKDRLALTDDRASVEKLLWSMGNWLGTGRLPCGRMGRSQRGGRDGWGSALGRRTRVQRKGHGVREGLKEAL